MNDLLAIILLYFFPPLCLRGKICIPLCALCGEKTVSKMVNFPSKFYYRFFVCSYLFIMSDICTPEEGNVIWKQL
jgi:hypothetical protein